LNSSYARSHQTKNFDIAVDLSEEQANVSHIEEFESGALKQLSRIAIQKTLEKTNGNISLAAKLLSISRNTLYRYLKSEPKR